MESLSQGNPTVAFTKQTIKTKQNLDAMVQ